MNSKLKTAIAVALCVAGLSVAVCLCALILSIRATVVCVPKMAAGFQAEALARVDKLQATLNGLPAQMIPPVVAAAQSEIRHGVKALDSRIADITAKDGRLDQAISIVNARLDQGITAADKRLGEVTATADRIRQDAKPLLGNAAALVQDSKDSWDDLYYDVKAGVASALVATTSAAQASEAVRDAAPKVSASVVSIGDSVAGVAADVKREADEITKPKKWYQKILGPVYTLGRLVAAFL